MMRTYYLCPGIIILSVVAVGLVALGNAHAPLRPLIALWFLFICPGMALVRPLRLRETRVMLSLAVALSLALDTVVAAVMLYAGMWSPNAALVVLMIIASGGAVLDVVISGIRTTEVKPMSDPIDRR
jgi:hypothetical protein